MKVIVTTTINPPTEALRKFARLADWELLVVGDRKTPHATYDDLSCRYLHPDWQAETYPELSAVIGWNSIQRRNIGFLEAWRLGAEVIATVDDDNIPLPGWGDDVVVGRELAFDCYDAACGVFDPLSVTNHRELWHRGFPVQRLAERFDLSHVGKQRRRALVQANLWQGDPDVDAVCRITLRPDVEFDVSGYYGSRQPAPFNSQNTILHRDAFPAYCVLPAIGRMDDIWAAYLFQHEHPNSVVFGPATVYQERNPHDLVTNLEAELRGYRDTHRFVDSLGAPQAFLPAATSAFLDVYRDQFR
ncbi:MAG: hypothetical protein AAGE01_08950 [Pseudomonadota bacterium]